MTLASAPVFSRASATVSNTGRPRCVAPPLPGEVPPTILVPYAIAASEWKVPFLPVKPWQMTLVFLSIRTDMESPGASSLRRGQQVGHGKYLECVSETEEHECSSEDAEPAPQLDPIEL